MTVFYELDLASLPRKSSDNVATLPGAPLRTLEGKLLSECSDREIEFEIVRRRIRCLPPLTAQVVGDGNAPPQDAA